ncbi:MAG: hypothetical protein ACK6D6_12485, partial [Planctomyces sp.]
VKIPHVTVLRRMPSRALTSGAGPGTPGADGLGRGGLLWGGIRLGVEHPEIWVTVESEDF